MAGSDAEEQLRLKAEAQLRQEFPDARIIHELNMQWGGIRLDLAAVRPDGLTLVELKSEKDVLKRLPAQIGAALRITSDVRVYAAEKHRKALIVAHQRHQCDEDGREIIIWMDGKNGSRSGRHLHNPAFVPDLLRCDVQVDVGEGFTRCWDDFWFKHHGERHVAEPMALLELLWADELTRLLAQAGISAPIRANRELKKRLAVEDMPLRQIRRGVCASLRARTFHRATKWQRLEGDTHDDWWSDSEEAPGLGTTGGIDLMGAVPYPCSAVECREVRR
jgi:hypothetical protein